MSILIKSILIFFLAFSLFGYSQDSTIKKLPKWTMGFKLGAIHYGHIKTQMFLQKRSVETTSFVRLMSEGIRIAM